MTDEVESVRSNVVTNPNCPAEALRILAEDWGKWISEQAREHPNYRPQRANE